METLPAETVPPPKQRRYRSWIGCFTLLVGLGVLFYYGYCWGLWGRGSLLLQYLFQCNCPVASEEARYPERVEVIVPACPQSYVELSPSGRFLYVHEEQSGLASNYLLDLHTMSKVEVTNQPFSSFLTDELGFIESGLEDYILDRTTGTQYPIKSFAYWRKDAYISGESNLELLVTTLHQAKQIFFIQNNDTVVVLMSDFPKNLEQNFTFGRLDIPGWDSDRVEQFLQSNNVIYHTIPAGFPDEALSPDGRFVARPDGIYLVETNQRIVKGYSASFFYRTYSGKYFSMRGWTYDGTGVIYSKFLNPCLIETNFLLFDDTGCFYEVPQPVIKLKMPQEYLLPQETP